jgi:hypothetical protein
MKGTIMRRINDRISTKTLWDTIALCGLVGAVAALLAASGCSSLDALRDKAQGAATEALGGTVGTPAETPTTQPDAGAHDLRLTVTKLTRSTVSFAWEPRPYGWPSKTVKVEVDAVVEMRRADGRGGKFDWIRTGGQSSKGLVNIHDGYGIWGVVGVPVSGERVTFRWVSVDGKKRSNDAEAVWP